MEQEDINKFTEERTCIYKDETYSVRDNGAVMRHPKENGKKRKLDGDWTWGTIDNKGFLRIGGEKVNRIVATAFHGVPKSEQDVVFHKNFNSKDNHPSNLIWVTKFEHKIFQPNIQTELKIITGKKTIEDILSDISILKSVLNSADAQNIAWMSKITQNEANKCLEKYIELNKEREQNDYNYSGEKISKEESDEKLENNYNHDLIKHSIFQSCINLGFKATEELSGKDWRADVFAEVNNKKFAFEIQLSPQTLDKTLKRQKKYIRDNIIGCWLFVKEPNNFDQERIDLPLFRVFYKNNELFVSLKGRENLSLETFINDFVNDKIHFCNRMITSKKQTVEVSFIEMNCWKCGAINHIYAVNRGFYSPCNAELHRDEMLWNSCRKEYMPEIQNAVLEFLKTRKGKKIKLGKIKERYSKTVEDSYISFGCAECDAIFGDFYVTEAILDSYYGDGVVERFNCEINMDIPIVINIPHWCHTKDGNFCE